MSATYQTITPAPDVSFDTSQLPNPIKCLVYIGLPDNPQFLGPQDPQALAEKIVHSRGPSGENRDYLYQLEEALRGLSEESADEHVFDLAKRCREVEAKEQEQEQNVR
jgi:cation transport protein ChaC